MISNATGCNAEHSNRKQRNRPRSLTTGGHEGPTGRARSCSAGGSFLPCPRRKCLKESLLQTVIDGVDAYYRHAQWHSVVSTPVAYSAAYPLPAIPATRAITGSAKYLNTGQMKDITDGAGNKVTHDFDGAFRYLGTADQDGLETKATLSTSSYVTSVKDERGKVTTNIYDSSTSFLIGVRSPDQKGVAYARDKNGNILFETFANHINDDGTIPAGEYNAPPELQPRTFSYQYDGLNRKTSKTDPLGHVTTFTYYTSGKLMSQTDPDGRSIMNTYDGAGRIVKKIQNPGGLVTSYSYASNGQIETIAYPDGRSTTYSYDSRGRKTSESTTGEGTTLYHFNGSGDMDTMTDAMGKITRYTFDNAHRMVMTTRPDGTTVKKGYDDAGYLTRSTDPKGSEFAFINTANGRRTEMDQNTGGVLHMLATYSYDANTPTSDGPMHWTLDDAGRVSTVNGAGANCTYSYAHPMGLMTQKAYGGVTLNYAYDPANRMQSMGDGTNSLTYTDYTPGGMPLNAQYSSGMQKSWSYDALWNVSSCKYANQNGTTLNEFRADYDNFGHRTSLKVLPTGDESKYEYDSAFRLSRERRTIPVPGLPSKFTDTTYQYDLVGNRTKRTVAGIGSDTYAYNDMYELNGIAHLDGSTTTLSYDDNGNTTSKSHTLTSLSISYINSSTATKQCTLNQDGQNKSTLFFPSTQGAYSTLSIPMTTDNAMLLIANTDSDTNGPTDGLTIDKVSVISENGVRDYPVSGATLGGNLAIAQPVTGFGTATGQFILFESLPWSGIQAGDYTYAFDVLNRLTHAERKQHNTSNILASGTFNYYGTHGWQVQTQTISSAGAPDDVRTFGYGMGGELLTETIPTSGQPAASTTRRYVNGGIDHVLWALDGAQGPAPTLSNFYLHDINGSVFALTNNANIAVERQRFDAYGNTQLTNESYTSTLTASTAGNRIGFQGRTNIAELGLQNFRNRFYDPGIGRFLNRDPLGLVDGPAVYAFCGGDPVNRGDPMGTEWEIKIKIVQRDGVLGYIQIGEAHWIAENRKQPGEEPESADWTFLQNESQQQLSKRESKPKAGDIISIRTPRGIDEVESDAAQTRRLQKPQTIKAVGERSQAGVDMVIDANIEVAKGELGGALLSKGVTWLWKAGKWVKAARTATTIARKAESAGTLVEEATTGVRAGEGIVEAETLAVKYRKWYSGLPLKPTPTSSAEDAFEIANTGSNNYLISGGGKQLWADGIRDTVIQEAKYIGNPERSPFIAGSKIPEFLRTKIVSDVEGEFARMAEIINSGETPLKSVEVITNNAQAVPFFEGLLKNFGLQGKVLVK